MKKSDGRPQSELMKMVLTLSAIAIMAQTGVDESSAGSRDADPVEEERQDNILLCLAIAIPTDAPGGQDGAQAIADDDDVGRLDRDVRPGSHRDPDISLHERRCVVDPITNHRDPAQFLQVADDLSLLTREHLGMHLLDTLWGAFIPSGWVGTVSTDPRKVRRCCSQSSMPSFA